MTLQETRPPQAQPAGSAPRRPIGTSDRAALEARLADDMDTSARTGTPVTVAVIDFDRFRRLVSRFGRQQGDEFLRSVTAAMVERLRAADTLAACGGEKFCAILADTTLRGSLAVLEELRRLVAEADRDRFKATVSVGAAQWDGRESLQDLLGRAELALYDAKGQGRNRVVLATPGAA